MSNWIVDRSKILQRDEIAPVLTDLRRKARRSTNSRMNLTIFRLAACCGLRASEIAGLVLSDVRVDNSRPSIRVRCEIGKGHKARKVPLTWDAGTLADLVEWKRFRRDRGPTMTLYSFAVSIVMRLATRSTAGTSASGSRRACKVLGRERQADLTIHDGRHSFVSHALHGGRSIVEVRVAAGHSISATTSIYAHLVDTDDKVGNLFDFGR